MQVTLKSYFIFRISDFRFQISESMCAGYTQVWIQISDFRFQISEHMWWLHSSQISDFRFQKACAGYTQVRFQIPDFRFQIPESMRRLHSYQIVEISDFRFQNPCESNTQVRFWISDFRFQISEMKSFEVLAENSTQKNLILVDASKRNLCSGCASIKASSPDFRLKADFRFWTADFRFLENQIFLPCRFQILRKSA